MEIFERLPFVLIGITVGLTIHEAAHAWMANFLGDPTAKYLGRITLNPIAHLEPVGATMILITALFGYGIGWGKPVPYNPHNLKNPRWGSFWIAIAGPLSNFITAAILMVPFIYLLKGGYIANISTATSLQSFGFYCFYFTIVINLSLMAFNLIPIPPLDGSKILAAFIPEKYNHELDVYFQNGPNILIGAILLEQVFKVPILSGIIIPIIDGSYSLLFFAT